MRTFNFTDVATGSAAATYMGVELRTNPHAAAPSWSSSCALNGAWGACRNASGVPRWPDGAMPLRYALSGKRVHLVVADKNGYHWNRTLSDTQGATLTLAWDSSAFGFRHGYNPDPSNGAKMRTQPAGYKLTLPITRPVQPLRLLLISYQEYRMLCLSNVFRQALIS